MAGISVSLFTGLILVLYGSREFTLVQGELRLFVGGGRACPAMPPPQIYLSIIYNMGRFILIVQYGHTLKEVSPLIERSLSSGCGRRVILIYGLDFDPENRWETNDLFPSR